MNSRAFKVDKLPSIKRLPAYLHLLHNLASDGEEYVSSNYLAEKMQLQPILVRKDLELTRVSGTPRIGYCISDLIKGIKDFLGWDESVDAFLVGAGCAGSFILGNRDLMGVGLKILAAFDKDPRKIGRKIHGVPVFDWPRLRELVSRTRVDIVILCVPPDEAQKVSDKLVAYGIKGIWNFTPTNLVVPEDVVVQKEDLASGLAVLSVKLNQSHSALKEGTFP